MQECKRCVMDQSDKEIQFDADGICNHCKSALIEIQRCPSLQTDNNVQLIKKISQIKTDGQNKEYDCVIGLSGGLDSSYLALKVRDWGLRPLVVHVDTGWNSEMAVHNIERILRYCNFDLYTHVVDWETMRDLQMAYLKSSIANQDVPQDHIIFSTIYNLAVERKIKVVLTGGNLATESIFVKSWHGSALDGKNLKSIHKIFGSRPLKGYKVVSFFEYYFLFPLIYGIRVERLLNLTLYRKSDALNELIQRVGYKPYGRKHGESNFTKLFQNYYLPRKFGIDKRRPHLSSLIVSGQISREDAVRALAEPLYLERELDQDINFFCKKLRISREEFNKFLNLPNMHHTRFKNWDLQLRILKVVQKTLSKFLGLRLTKYS